MNLKTITLILSICLITLSCTDNKLKNSTIVSITSIANKSIEEVNAVLGKPDSIKKTDITIKVNPVGMGNETVPANIAYYKNNSVKIIFIENVADIITINNVPKLTMDEGLITSLGLPQTNPYLFNPSSLISWENIAGIDNISFFSTDSNLLDNIDIRVNLHE